MCHIVYVLQNVMPLYMLTKSNVIMLNECVESTLLIRILTTDDPRLNVNQQKKNHALTHQLTD